ncbi:protein SMAX1-LIKE 3-like [Lolium perenne]|uniref:protein SMAX1-LIKE 3-like n=1 Tax=Lolium perenne TaxID=4522 RepID=UPI0021F60155|nr:protein SMAX1-LIKE 3-like [Lolium perenne]
MRSAGYEVVQQALVEVAAAAVWQAANLARRRGHAQVTPLHVASAMLSTGGLLRAACLRSSSHLKSPALQPEALQFCIDVALSRLPMVWPPAAAMFSNHGAPVMVLSNALVAALKRAQAHERRGSAEGGQRQPGGLVVKVGLEQLVVSILDDPSVDRALREAGFSGPQVKANVGKGASSEQSDSVHSHRSDDIASPWPISKKANAGQTSSETVGDVLHRPVVIPDRSLALTLSCHSGDQACQTKPSEAWPAFFGLTNVTTMTASVSSWLHHRQDVIPTCHNTSLQPTCMQQKFIELTSENLKILCDALERCVPWRKDIAPTIAAIVLRCRSGMMRRPASSMACLLFRGNDVNGKRAMAQELAKLVFGSYSEFTLINSADTSSNAGDRALKRRRSPDVGNGNVGIRLFEALIEEPHRVVFIDNIDQIDHESEIAIKNVIATGRVMGCNGAGIASLEDAIVVLSSEVSEPRSFTSSSPPTKRRRIGGLDHGEGGAERQVESRHFVFDLNAPMEDAEEQEEGNSVDSMEIMGVVDGVFHFD